MKQTYKKAVASVGYDGTSERVIAYYESIDAFRDDTQFNSDEEFSEYVTDKFNVNVNEIKGSIIVLDRVGSLDGTIFTDKDDNDIVLQTIVEYFK